VDLCATQQRAGAHRYAVIFAFDTSYQCAYFVPSAVQMQSPSMAACSLPPRTSIPSGMRSTAGRWPVDNALPSGSKAKPKRGNSSPFRLAGSRVAARGAASRHREPLRGKGAASRHWEAPSGRRRARVTADALREYLIGRSPQRCAHHRIVVGPLGRGNLVVIQPRAEAPRGTCSPRCPTTRLTDAWNISARLAHPQ